MGIFDLPVPSAARLGSVYAAQTAARLGWAYSYAYRLSSAVRDANGVATSGVVEWPDGATGTYLALVPSLAHLGKVDAWVVTHTLDGVTTYFTQPAVTRDGGGNITAQPAIQVASSGVIDTFDRANTTSGLGTATTGTAWTHLGSGSYGITSGQAYGVNTPAAHCYTVQDIGASNVQVYVRISGNAASNSQGLLFRATGANDGYLLTINDGGALKVYRNGTFTQIGSFTSTIAPGDVISVSAVGTAIKASINGAQVISITDSTSNGTKHGLWFFSIGDGTARRWDNFALLNG